MNTFESKNFQIFTPERLVFEVPKTPKKSTPATPEKKKPKEKKPKLWGAIGEAYKESVKYVKAKKKLDKDFKKKRDKIFGRSPEETSDEKRPESFFEQLDKGDPKKLEELHKKALSDEVSETDLEGGWEWLGLKEEEQEQKHTVLAQIYLDREEKDGEVTYRIKDILDKSPKLVKGIGAEDLLPPSVKAVEIETPDGKVVKGKRKIVDGKVGYYDEDGKYIETSGGCKLRPIEFIDEESDEYKEKVEAEKQSYIKIRDKKETPQKQTPAKPTPTTPAEGHSGGGGSVDSGGSIDSGGSSKEAPSPPSSSPSPRRAPKSSAPAAPMTEEELEQQKAATAAEALKVEKDSKKIRVLIDVFGIKPPADESNLQQLRGKGAEKLGWKEENDTQQKTLMEKLSDKDFVKAEIAKWEEGQTEGEIEGIKVVKDEEAEDGYFFKNSKNKKAELEECVLEKVAMGIKENETVKFIKAMQNGKGEEFMGYKFAGNYQFEIKHLKKLHKLTTEDPGKLREHLEEAKKISDPIAPTKLIEIVFKTEEGMSYEEAIEVIKGIPGFDYLLNARRKFRLSWLTKMAKKRLEEGKTVEDITYDFDNYADREKHVFQNGKNACAAEVSSAMGLPRGKLLISVRKLIPPIMAGNLKRTGKEGIVVGFENFRKGDVCVFAGHKSKAFTHVAIVRNKFTLPDPETGEPVKYLAILHNYDALQVDIVPVDAKSTAWKGHQETLRKNPQALAQQSPEMADILEYRKKWPKTVRFKNDNRKFVQDGSQVGKTDGNIAFAVRTEGLVKGAS
jgi:hypothetical protein